MTNSVRDAIRQLKEGLQKQLDDVAETKRAINTMAKSIGDALPYPEIASESIGGIRPDQFFSKPLAGAVREYLAMRGHAATVGEILDGLRQGGFDFGRDKFAEKNLRISLGKNSQTFVQVKGSDSFGLLEFYPNLKRESKEAENGGTETLFPKPEKGKNKKVGESSEEEPKKKRGRPRKNQTTPTETEPPKQ